MTKQLYFLLVIVICVCPFTSFADVQVPLNDLPDTESDWEEKYPLVGPTASEKAGKEQERQRLLAMTNAEIIREIEGASKEDASQLLELIGERSKELPFSLIYNIIGFGLLAEPAVFHQLRILFYPGSKEGIKQFQTDIGVEANGDLTWGQAEELQRRISRFNDTRIIAGAGKAGDKPSIGKFEGYVFAEGTWILEDDDIAYPINTAKIECDQEKKICQVVQASVFIPSLDSASDFYSISLDSSPYPILSWNTNEIMAEASSDCRTSTLTINFNSEEVFEITRNNKTKQCREGFLALPSLEKPRIARLVSGWDRTYKWWDDRKEKISEYMNPRYKNEMKGLFDSLQSQ